MFILHKVELMKTSPGVGFFPALVWKKRKNIRKKNGKLITNNRKTVFTSSTCSVVKGPPYFDLLRSIREGMSSSQYVKALRLRGALCLAANLRTR